MRYAYPGTFIPLKILMMSPLIMNLRHHHYLIHPRITALSLSSSFIFLFRRVLLFIFLAIFLFCLDIAMTLAIYPVDTQCCGNIGFLLDLRRDIDRLRFEIEVTSLYDIFFQHHNDVVAIT